MKRIQPIQPLELTIGALIWGGILLICSLSSGMHPQGGVHPHPGPLPRPPNLSHRALHQETYREMLRAFGASLMQER